MANKKKVQKPDPSTRRDAEKEAIPPKNKPEAPDWDRAATVFDQLVRSDKEEILRLCDADTYRRFERP